MQIHLCLCGKSTDPWYFVKGIRIGMYTQVELDLYTKRSMKTTRNWVLRSMENMTSQVLFPLLVIIISLI